MLKYSIIFFILLNHLAISAQGIFDIEGKALWLRSDSGVILNNGKVEKWTDFSGNNRDAIQLNESNKPVFIDSVAIINFKPVIRFDGVDDFLSFPEIIDIKDCFFVIKHRTGTGTINSFQPILGHSVFFDFIGGDDSLLFRTSFISPNILNGEIKVNALNENPLLLNKPQELSILSIFPTGNLRAEYITNDRNIGNQNWDGDYAEILLFNKSLSEEERAQVENYFRKKYVPPVEIGASLIRKNFCDTIIRIDAKAFKNFKWYHESIRVSDSDSVVVNKPGYYKVQYEDVFGFEHIDSFNIIYPFNQINVDQILCGGDSLIWDSGLSKNNFSFKWSDDSTDSTVVIKNAGTYWVTAEDEFGCKLTSAFVTVELDSFPISSVIGPQNLCKGDSLYLLVGAYPDNIYLWNNSLTDSKIEINTSGQYWVDVLNHNGCKFNDTIQVNVVGAPPVVNFSFNNVCAGIEVHFENLSLFNGAASYYWRFEDDETSIEENPVHQFFNPGVYNITLEVTDDFGCAASIQKELTVFPNPEANFQNPSISCVSEFLHFKNKSNISLGNIVNYFIDWGDGDFSSSFSHRYENEGEYLIKLITTSDNGCKDSIFNPVNIYSCQYPSSVLGLTIWLSADSGITNISGNVNKWEDLSGNHNHATQFNSVNQPLFIESIEALNSLPVLRFDGINDFMAFPEQQNIRDGFFIIKHKTGFQNDFPPILGHSVSYDFIGGEGHLLFRQEFLSAGLLNGQLSINKSIELISSVKKPTEYSIISFHSANDLTAEYITNDRNFSGAFWNGDYVEIILFSRKLDDNERFNVESYLHYKYAPPVNLGPNIISQNFCDTVIRAGKRFQSFEWFYEGNLILGANADSIIVTQPGKYWVDVVDIFGFTSSDTIEVIYPPFNQLAGNKIICLDDSIEWKSDLNSSFSFLWSTGSISDKIYLKEQGQYWVDITKDGCTFTSDTVTVIIDSYSQIASLGPDTALCSGNELFLKQGADVAQSYLWSDNSTGELLVVTDPGVYHVAVTNINGCIARDTIEVTIKGIAPDVDFNFRNVCKDQPMQLFDSTDPMGSTIVEYLWEIDNSIYQSKDISHTFNQSGFFDVKLIVTTANGCKDEAVKQVAVYTLPDPDFLFSSACSGQSVEFIDNSFDPVGIEAWSWNFNNPTSGSENTSLDKDPQHIFDSPGDYNVQLIVTSGKGCIDSVLRIVNVKETPSSDFTFENRCFGLPIEFEPVSSNGVAAYNWEFGDGRNSQFVSGSHFYEYWGSYQAALTVFGTNGCNASTSKNVAVYELASIMFSPLNACIGVPVEFNDQSQTDTDAIVSWAWTFENDGSVYSDQPQVVYVFNDLGVRKVKLEVLTENGCESSASIDVAVYALPLSAFTIMPSVVVPDYPVYFNNFSNGSQTYFWDFGDGNSSIEFEPTHVFDNVGAHIITLNAVSPFGCENSFSRSINIIPANLDIAVNNIIVNNRNSYLEIIAELINYGSVEVSDLELFLELKNGRRLKEKWQGSFGSGQRMLYSFNAELVSLRNDPLDYVCVSARNSLHHKDSNPLNNDFCKLINDEDIILFDPNPNPVKDDLLIRFFLPRAEEANLEIFSAEGRIIAENLAVSPNKGLNQVIFRTSDLNQGLYLIKLTTSSGRIFVKRFIKTSR
jgi:PKD repeat protein